MASRDAESVGMGGAPPAPRSGSPFGGLMADGERRRGGGEGATAPPPGVADVDGIAPATSRAGWTARRMRTASS